MKIRSNYVSNSSSSSFVIYGEGAKEYVERIEDGQNVDVYEIADTVYFHKVLDFYSADEAIFIKDEEWLKDFKENYHLPSKLPLSIYNREKGNLIRSYKNDFVVWFVEKFSNESFYEIEFSDHPSETKYSEFEMYDIMNDYEGNYFTTNNH